MNGNVALYCNVDSLCEACVVVQVVGSLLGVGLWVRGKHSHLWVLLCNVELPWRLLPLEFSQDGCCNLAAAAAMRRPHNSESC